MNDRFTERPVAHHGASQGCACARPRRTLQTRWLCAVPVSLSQFDATDIFDQFFRAHLSDLPREFWDSGPFTINPQE